jgi:hypothetical protein
MPPRPTLLVGSTGEVRINDLKCKDQVGNKTNNKIRMYYY